MCKSKTNLARWISLCALLSTIVIFALAAQVAQGQTFIQLSSGPQYPAGGLLVGSTGVTLNYRIVNNSDGGIVIDTINYVPACDNSNYPCTAPANVFTNFSSGTGGGACTGITFTFSGSAVSSTGFTVTPSQTITLASGEACTFSFTANVTTAPVNDSNPGSTGLQTTGVGHATAHGSINTGLTGSGSGSSDVTILTCAVQIDKQVSCDAGVSWADPGFADGAINGCAAPLNTTVLSQYIVRNTGTANASCSLTDTNAGGTLFSVAAGGVSITAGATNPALSGFSTACTQAFGANEPNTGLLSCTCTDPNNGTAQASDSDTARITCTANPAFNVSKACVPGASAGSFTSKVTINNTGDVALSCSVSDQTFAGACPPTGTGTPVTGFTNPYAIAVGSTDINSASFTLAATSCNQATVGCTFDGNAVGGAQTATDVCPVNNNGCFTRTPGYWGTHTLTTQQVIGAGLDICGITLTGTTAGIPGSATEDLCVNSLDAKQNQTSTQQTSLIRACTAAALNLRVSNDPGAQLSCEGAVPGITAVFNSCCVGPTSTCDSGKSGTQIAATTCITSLDAFNNQFDSTNFPSFLNNTNVADPLQCQNSTGNGFMNPGRNLGSKK